MLELAVLLFFVGIALIVIELFVPSMGVLSVAAGICFIAAIVLAFRESTEIGAVFLAATVIAVPIVLFIGFKIFPSTPMGRRMILTAPDRSDAKPGADVSTEPRHDLVGRSGRAISALRPAGLVEIEDQRVDVITEGEWIDAGTDVVVTSAEGNRLVVKAEGESPAGDDRASKEKP